MVLDSVHCEALWDLLCLCVIPAWITGLLPGLSPRTKNHVVCVGGGDAQLLSCRYGSEAGVHPCPITFQHLRTRYYRELWGSHCGVPIGNSRTNELVFAIGAILLAVAGGSGVGAAQGCTVFGT